MITLPVYKEDGQRSGEVDCDETAFGSKVLPKLMRRASVAFEANQRQGTHSTLSRGEVAGSTAKPWRQKGTGRARSGSRKSPVWLGGGVVFGPKPRDYRLGMNKKARRVALRSALLVRLLENKIVVVDGFDFPEPKTSRLSATLMTLGVDRSCLVVSAEVNSNLVKSGRNIPNVTVRTVTDLNCYEVIRNEQLVVTKNSFARILELVEKK